MINLKEIKTAAFLARKDTLKDWKIFVLVIVALSFSLLNIVFIQALMSGLVSEIYAQTVDLSTGHMVIEPDKDQEYLYNINNLEKKLEALSGVVGISPRYVDRAIIIEKKHDKKSSTTLIAFTPSRENDVTQLYKKIKSGEFLSDGDENEILIGKTLADDLELAVGDKVKMVFSNGVSKEFRIKGVLDAGMEQIDRGSIYVTTQGYDKFLNVHDKASSVVIRLADINQVENYRYMIIPLTRGEVYTWKTKTEYIQRQIESWGMVTVMTTLIGILTAATAIAIIIYINTSSKKREIAILKAIGGSNSFIMTIYTIESIIFGLLGILFGNIVAYGILGYMANHPLQAREGFQVIPVYNLDLAISASIILFLSALTAGIYPAWKAAKTNITKTIWGV
ncbi:MAG: FtsX-like permease family protein [Candidatus Methanoperedens sp.]|nr:FtsX-like permease family protein [Candidatus Methanoperedens sp.]